MPTPVLLQELPSVTIRCTVVSGMANNVYLLTDKSTGAQILIDAANDFPAVTALLNSAQNDSESSPVVQVIATTHSHFDHIQALSETAASTGARTAAGALDAESIQEQCGVVTEQSLDHGAQIKAGNLTLQAVLLRGHTPGSMAYVLQSEGTSGEETTLIFSGDSLFPGGVGNTNQNPQRFKQLFEDVTQRLFDVYPNEAVVYPGHGNSTTLGIERPSLPEWHKRGW